MKAAMATHDGTTLAALLAPNFVSIDVSGQSESASQMIAEVNGLKADPNRTSNATLVSIVPAKNSATVKQQYDMKTIVTRADGTTHNVELITLSTDSWVKITNVWKIEKTTTNEMSYFLDGKLVAHKVNS